MRRRRIGDLGGNDSHVDRRGAKRRNTGSWSIGRASWRCPRTGDRRRAVRACKAGLNQV